MGVGIAKKQVASHLWSIAHVCLSTELQLNSYTHVVLTSINETFSSTSTMLNPYFGNNIHISFMLVEVLENACFIYACTLATYNPILYSLYFNKHIKYTILHVW